jgi:programmed cell death 6-interacting protein
VKKKYEEFKDLLKTLSGSDCLNITLELEGTVHNLYLLLGKWTYIEDRRRMKIENIQEKAKKEDINSAILAETSRLEREYPETQVSPASFENFSKQCLAEYNLDVESVKGEATDQDQILEELKILNMEFVAPRTVTQV